MRMGPLAQNQAVGLAGVLGRIGLGADIIEAEAPCTRSGRRKIVARAIVRAGLGGRIWPPWRKRQQLSILHDLPEGDAGRVVDADMHALPARSLSTGAQML